MERLSSSCQHIDKGKTEDDHTGMRRVTSGTKYEGVPASNSMVDPNRRDRHEGKLSTFEFSEHQQGVVSVHGVI